jgi:hypothetical protein
MPADVEYLDLETEHDVVDQKGALVVKRGGTRAMKREVDAVPAVPYTRRGVHFRVHPQSLIAKGVLQGTTEPTLHIRFRCHHGMATHALPVFRVRKRNAELGDLCVEGARSVVEANTK